MQPMRLLITGTASDDRITGTLLSGELTSSMALVLMPSGEMLGTALLTTPDGDSLQSANPDTEVHLQLSANIAVQTGQLIVQADARPEVADQFMAQIEWLDPEPMLPGRNYQLTAPAGTTRAAISRLKYRLDAGQQAAASELQTGETGVVNLALSDAIAYDPVALCPALAEFTLHSENSHTVLGRGHVLHGLRRASNVHWQALAVDQQSRAAIKQQTPKLIWLTGLSGSGKSTIANLLEKKLLACGRHSYLLDGDNVRHGLNKDLGFTDADRVENIRRVAETAKLMLDAGLIVISSFISPFRAERAMARQLLPAGQFVEVFVNTPLAVCEERDPKGLYGKARRGDIKNFTGIDSPYEAPEAPDLIIDTVNMSPQQAAERIFESLQL